MGFPFQPSLSFDGENAAAGLGQDVNTHATSCVTLVFDDGKNSRAHKVIKDFLMHWLEICGTGELVGGVAATGLGPNVNIQCRFPV